MEIEICFANEQRKVPLLALENKHPDGLGTSAILEAIAGIRAEHAEATNPSDKEKISNETQRDTKRKGRLLGTQ